LSLKPWRNYHLPLRNQRSGLRLRIRLPPTFLKNPLHPEGSICRSAPVPWTDPSCLPFRIHTIACANGSFKFFSEVFFFTIFPVGFHVPMQDVRLRPGGVGKDNNLQMGIAPAWIVRRGGTYFHAGKIPSGPAYFPKALNQTFY